LSFNPSPNVNPKLSIPTTPYSLPFLTSNPNPNLTLKLEGLACVGKVAGKLQPLTHITSIWPSPLLICNHKDEYASAKRQAFLLSGALKRLMKRQLSMAWERWQAQSCDSSILWLGHHFDVWQEWYALLKDQQFRLAGALRRMMNRQLSMGWEKWQEWYAQIKDQQRLMGGAISRFMKRQMSMAWEQWQW
jgi:hypothetical protein